MKKVIFLSLALASAVCLSGCNTPQGQNAAGGAVLGGATGAVIGGAVSNSAGGALAGGLIGATAGAMIGSAATAPRLRPAAAPVRGVGLRLLRQPRLPRLLLEPSHPLLARSRAGSLASGDSLPSSLRRAS